MTRAGVRRRLALEWWRWLGFAYLAPLFFLNLLFGGSQALGSVLEMPLFIAGLASMFVSLPLFSAWRVDRHPGRAGWQHEREAWLALAVQRRKAFLGAGLPAWIAAIALFSGLNAVALILLALSNVVLLCLYRIPRQLG